MPVTMAAALQCRSCGGQGSAVLVERCYRTRRCSAVRSCKRRNLSSLHPDSAGGWRAGGAGASPISLAPTSAHELGDSELGDSASRHFDSSYHGAKGFMNAGLLTPGAWRLDARRAVSDGSEFRLGRAMLLSCSGHLVQAARRRRGARRARPLRVTEFDRTEIDKFKL